VALRPVETADQTFLLDASAALVPAQRADALLARCLELEDAASFVPALRVGDRDALLLQLRRITLGDRFDAVLACPQAACGEPLDLDLRVSDLLVAPYPAHAARAELRLQQDGVEFEVTAHPPTAGDQERAAALALRDDAAAAAALLSSCVERVRCGEREAALAELGPAAAGEIAQALAELDPQAEIELDVTCAACGGAFAAAFDVATFFLSELDRRARGLLRDVHALALHYHWSERDILALAPARRQQYLELLGETPDGAFA
jgi:hypothetical protein